MIIVNNNKNKKKKYRIVAIVAVLYLVLVIGLIARDKILNITSQKYYTPDGQTTSVVNTYESKKAKADNNDDELKSKYEQIINNLSYDAQNAEIEILKEDCQSIITSNNLPSLTRMNSDDADKYMGEIKVLKRMENIGVNPDDYETPELNWKILFNTVVQDVTKQNSYNNQVVFTGATASELNAFIQSVDNAYITITSSRIVLDETVQLKSNIGINAKNVHFEVGDTVLNKAFEADECTNFTVDNVNLSTGRYDYALYIIKSHYFTVQDCTLSSSNQRGLVMMGENTNFIIKNNDIENNGNGAVFLEGDISEGVIRDNVVSHNGGTRNLNAGICLTSMEITDYNVIYDVPPTDEYLYDLTEAPHNIVLYRNTVEGNNSSGIYSDGGYNLFMLENTIRQNDKEGMCLDSGTFGSYVSDNVVKENGGRRRQSDADLEGDFIAQFGRIEDGSSPAKLPGISIDNAAYNIVIDNDVTHNYGSGVKMVRSAYRNIVMQNTVSDNNVGRSGDFHFFGVEIGYASTPDQPVKGLDFTASYENIICRNVITGSNYSGIYMAEECYCNDIFDNVILGSQIFSIECKSNMFNSIVNNNVDNDIENHYVN